MNAEYNYLGDNIPFSAFDHGMQQVAVHDVVTDWSYDLARFPVSTLPILATFHISIQIRFFTGRAIFTRFAGIKFC